MPKIVIKFRGAVRGERTLDKSSASIGRNPTCDIPIDNLAVSRHHADIVLTPGGHEIVDRKSSNGTHVNGRRVNRAVLKDGDTIQVGKHTLLFVDHGDDASEAAPKKPFADQMATTMEMQSGAASLAAKKLQDIGVEADATISINPTNMKKPARLVVVKGTLNQPQYHLANDATFIGKGEQAEIRLLGDRAPRTAAVIHRRQGGHTISPSETGLTLNGKRLLQRVKLESGDLIAIQEIVLRFEE